MKKTLLLRELTKLIRTKSQIVEEPTLVNVLIWLKSLDSQENGNRAYNHFVVFRLNDWDLSKSLFFQSNAMIIALLNYAKAFAEVPSLIS